MLKRESVSSREENEESKQRWLELTDKDNVFTHRYPLFLESALQFLRNPVIQSVQMNDMVLTTFCLNYSYLIYIYIYILLLQYILNCLDC